MPTVGSWPGAATAPNSTETNTGTWGGVEPPCGCNVVPCNHTLEPLRSQGAMPKPCAGLKRSSFESGQAYGGDKVR